MGQLILPGPKWDNILQKLSNEKLYDISYHSDYINCYASIGDSIEAYLHQEENKFLFFPYVKSPIPGHDGLYDFQSAHGYSGPISNTLDKKFLQRAWLEFSKLANKNCLIAGLVRFHPLLETHKYASSETFNVIKDREIVYLSLKREMGEVWYDFSRDNKEKIKKAKKLNVSLKCDSELSSIKEFSKFYEKRMYELNADKYYLFNNDYFYRIYKLGQNCFSVYKVFVNDMMIGGAVILFSDRFVHYHLSASSREFFKFAPNNILRYSVIKDLLGKRYNYLIFGGGRTSSPNDSLLSFKKRFSKETAWYYHATSILNQKAYDQICEIWEKDNPEKKEKFSSFVLKYRY